VLPSSEVQAALGEIQRELSSWYELVSEGADYLTLEQWLRAIDGRQLLTDVSVRGHAVRLTEPQARGAFFLAATHPVDGLLPSELSACVVKTACEKYRGIEVLSNGMRFTNGDRVRAFVANLLGTADEEEALADVRPAAGWTPPPAAADRAPAPARRPPAAGQPAATAAARGAAPAPADARPRAAAPAATVPVVGASPTDAASDAALAGAGQERAVAIS